MTTELQDKALTLFKLILEREEGETDKLLSTLTEAEEIQEELELAGHLLDVHLGYEEGCDGLKNERGFEIARITYTG